MERESQPNRRRRRGIVVSDAMEKTVGVRVERVFRHPRVGRVVRRHRVFLAHDEENRAKVGDAVLIEETRPLSRRKRWRVVEILTPAQSAETTAADTAGKTEEL